MPLRLKPQPWALVVAVVFAAYVIVLLANAYQSQGQLRAATEARVLADNRQVARLIGDFLAEQRHAVVTLAESREIETYLTNKALGMSMRYGLSASLIAIEESFRNGLGRRTVFGEPVYDRILYLDETGERLVDTEAGTPLNAIGTGLEVAPRLRIDDAHGWIIASAPVDLRGKPGGALMTLSRLARLSRHLTEPGTDLGFRRFLITETGLELGVSDPSRPGGVPAPALIGLPPESLTPLDAMPDLVKGRFSENYDLVLRLPIAGTSLSLVTLLPESLLYGHITSRRFLLFATLVPAILLLAALWIDRIRRHARRLQADVIESHRDRMELQDRNEALTSEIARREALERRLRESEERYRTYIEHAPEGVFVSDSSGRLIDANPSACDMVGYSRAELLAMTVTDLSPPGLEAAHSGLLEQVLRIGRKEVEIDLRSKDGLDMVANLRAIALPGGLVMGFCVDITERKRAEARIHSLAYFDPLTGLPNRRMLLDRLGLAMMAGRRHGGYGALIMLDLDHFKDINDTQGHDVGDRLLVEVARRLVDGVRGEDTVSRLGGDEFVVVANDLGTEASGAAPQAEMIAEKIRHALARPYALSEGRPAHHATASLGVALFKGQEVTVDLLLKQSDVALYQAKSAGRDTIRFFNPDMQANIDARASMESALRLAIGQRELRLHYQPQVDRHGQATGAEALLRWLPPSGEPIPPGRFIPLAEETGLILPIGAFVLEEACAQLRRWQADPRTASLVLSINVSARQFNQTDFVEQVRARIEHFGVVPSRLKLELTESVVLDRAEQLIGRMRALKDFGVGFSLDDFGTGYSSLSYLKRLPLDQVKIDQSFVRDITHDTNDAAIVRAVLAMSHSLGLNVIAEGVETEEQRALLLEFGCEHFQGYLFGNPAPIEDNPRLSIADASHCPTRARAASTSESLESAVQDWS
ncbi:EAL domain-containing protein [Thiocystis violacea]|uniref:EAL domain-containing protein n=1 Tax=Thiocystis violacea TaxID=13725 RepID=UPI0019059BF7